jgi:hypothetical protein
MLTLTSDYTSAMKLVKDLLTHLTTIIENQTPLDSHVLGKLHTDWIQIGSMIKNTYHESWFNELTERNKLSRFLTGDFRLHVDEITEYFTWLVADIDKWLTFGLSRDCTFYSAASSVSEAPKTLSDYTSAMRSKADDIFLNMCRDLVNIPQDTYALRAPGDSRPFSTEGIAQCHALLLRSNKGHYFFAHISPTRSSSHSHTPTAAAQFFIKQRQQFHDPVRAIILYSENSYLLQSTELRTELRLPKEDCIQVKLICQQEGYSKAHLDLAVDGISVVWRYGSGIVYREPLSSLMEPSTAESILEIKGALAFRAGVDAETGVGAGAGAGAGASALLGWTTATPAGPGVEERKSPTV